MGKRGRPRNSASSPPESRQNQSVTLREEKTGKSANKKNPVKLKDRLKLEHLENLASWAAGEANIPSLAAFYGRRLAAVRESLGVTPNHSSSPLFHCERCETILRPGTNCTVSAKKHKANEKSGRRYQVYSCHFCSHGNLRRDKTSNETRVHGNYPELAIAESKPQMPSPDTKKIELSNLESNPSPTLLTAPGVGSGPTLSDTKKIELSNAESNASPMLLGTPGGRTLLETNKRKRKKPSGKKSALSNVEAATSVEKSWANGKSIPFSL